jgi:hypothetical protein
VPQTTGTGWPLTSPTEGSPRPTKINPVRLLYASGRAGDVNLFFWDEGCSGGKPARGKPERPDSRRLLQSRRRPALRTLLPFAARAKNRAGSGWHRHGLRIADMRQTKSCKLSAGVAGLNDPTCYTGATPPMFNTVPMTTFGQIRHAREIRSSGGSRNADRDAQRFLGTRLRQ